MLSFVHAGSTLLKIIKISPILQKLIVKGFPWGHLQLGNDLLYFQFPLYLELKWHLFLSLFKIVFIFNMVFF